MIDINQTGIKGTFTQQINQINAEKNMAMIMPTKEKLILPEIPFVKQDENIENIFKTKNNTLLYAGIGAGIILLLLLNK